MITQEIYSKEFESEISSEGGNHRTDEYFPSNSKEDLKLREKIIEQFSLKRHSDDGWDGKYQGFDGKFLYFFNFDGSPNGDRKSEVEEVEKLKYKTKVHIKKSGNSLTGLSDLEKFLIDNKFLIEV